jgi:hypothetical protein
MFHQQTRLFDVFALLIVAIAFLPSPCRMLAQRGGGAHVAKPVICVYDCPNTDGLSSSDDLKQFHRVMAMQATPEQRAAFAKVAQYTQAASDQLQLFRESPGKIPASSPLSDRIADLSQAIARARAGSQNFLTSFSSAQKSGLKDITSRLEKADSELDTQIKTLDRTVQSPHPESEQISSSAAGLDKSLAGFQSEQLALGTEMGIVLPADGQDLAFNLPKVTTSIDLGGEPVSIAASGAVSRTSADNGRNLFSVKVVADLSELQQNITGILRSQLTRASHCGERVQISQATLTPLAPASLVVVNVHYERWICPPGGRENAIEVANGDAVIEVKLTPSVEQNTGLGLAPEITHVETQGFLRVLLRSGDLGVTLRDQIVAALLSAMRKAADLKAALPPAARESATLQKAQFQSAGADQLNLLLEGQLQLSDEQTNQFAAQLKQRLAAQGTSPP